MSNATTGVESHDWGPDGPEKGEVLYDAEFDRPGLYLDTAANGRFWLRPVAGGREWPANPALTYPVVMAEQVRARIAEARRASGAQDAGAAVTVVPGQYAERGFAPEPLPVYGCGECAELDARRDRYRLVHDLSGVTDCNVLMRRHPHETP